MTELIYHVTQEVPCRFCGGKSKKCYVCQGSGVEGAPVTAPVSVLVWQDGRTITNDQDGEQFLGMYQVYPDGAVWTGMVEFNAAFGEWRLYGTLDEVQVVAYATLPEPPLEVLDWADREIEI